jgi:predicted porin
MKKSTLALAIAAALTGFGTVAQADTTLYGSARVSVDYTDLDVDGVDPSWDVYNNASRLGVRGEEDLGGGLSAIYQYEFGVDVTEGTTGFNSNRPKWVGLKGNSWGSVTAGTQWTPYYNVIGIGDIFNSSKVFNSAGLNYATSSIAPTQVLNTYLGNTYGLRMDNSLIYTSPNWSGFSAQAMLVMNGTCGTQDPQAPADLCGASSAGNRVANNVSDSVDMWNIAASYKNGPFFAGATYMALEGNSLDEFYTAPNYNGDQWGLAFGYNSGPFAVTLAYEQGDMNTVYYGDSGNIYVTGQYTFGNNVIRASYGYLEADDDLIPILGGGFIEQGNLNNYAIGYQYNLSKRTRVWAEYLGANNSGDIYGDLNVFSIGTRHDF